MACSFECKLKFTRPRLASQIISPAFLLSQEPIVQLVLD